jgi:hypothetical protein
MQTTIDVAANLTSNLFAIIGQEKKILFFLVKMMRAKCQHGS